MRGVQRNLLLETQHQDLAEDAEHRIHALRQAREAVLQRLGKQFTVRSSAAAAAAATAAAGDGQVQKEVKLNMMTGGAGVRAIGDGMGMGMQKGMMVPLMIFR